MFSLLIVVILLFAMIVVDVGFLIMEKGKVQNAVDAAALAGAQELPDDPVAAEAVARDYFAANGIAADGVTISFECTSTILQICNPALGKYDTIVIGGTSQAPTFFGGVLGMVGDAGCWADGCTVKAAAAACSGACGSSTGQVDVVTVIDHTGSMSVTDLQNAKDGAKTFYRTFDYTKHNVALSVTPPVHTTDLCDTVEKWTDSLTWLPVGLNNVYQTAPNVLDDFSPLVSTTNCLDRASGSSDVPGPHTNLGDPIKAAMNELVNNGRPNVPKGIVLFTDGAANIMDPVAAVAVGATGPCDYAMKMADQAKAAGIELYAIAYGAGDSCDRDVPGSFWYNKTAVELLGAMATDANHFFNEPRTSDLDPIFQTIGLQLTGKTKLIK
jgi:Flp pilus assembly protein TadG